MSSQHKGIVTQIIGPVLDIRFAEGELPELRNAITIQHREQVITAEVAQHIGDNVVRCIAMNSTDGLVRGMEAIDTGAPISVPVGEECLGRIFNLLGEPIDHGAPVKAEERWAIHVPPPRLRISRARPRSWKPASRSSILSAPTPRAARSGCSAAPASAKPSSSWSSSIM